MIDFCEKHKIEFKREVIDIAGVKIYKNCPKCEEDIKKENENKERDFISKQKEIKKELFLKELENRGCNKQYLSKRDSLDYNIGAFKELRGFLEVKDKNFINNESAIILGSCGIGKSFFSYKMIEVGLLIGKNIKCFKMLELISIYKKSFSNFEKIEAIIIYLDCLIIDEIDDGFGNSEVIKQLVSFCYDKGIRLMILGNCDLKYLFNNLEPKTISRLHTFKILALKGIKDMRCN